VVAAFTYIASESVLELSTRRTRVHPLGGEITVVAAVKVNAATITSLSTVPAGLPRTSVELAVPFVPFWDADRNETSLGDVTSDAAGSLTEPIAPALLVFVTNIAVSDSATLFVPNDPFT
jgi:hypothetical protein